MATEPTKVMGATGRWLKSSPEGLQSGSRAAVLRRARLLGTCYIVDTTYLFTGAV